MAKETPICVEVFLAACRAIQKKIAMTPRSANDKEYFPQDWFLDRVNEISHYTCEQSGRNSYPDFWVNSREKREGYEIKSLSFTSGRPARKDIDFNSTIPSGKKEGCDVFLVFFLYTGSGSNARDVQSFVISHGDLINADHELADLHENHAIRGFGSYGDGFIRDRKMYVLPHPLTIYPKGIGMASLIVPSSWDVKHPNLKKVDTINRPMAEKRLKGYTIDLWGGEPSQVTENSPRANTLGAFDVFQFTD
jgi:hypothetical protein